jgi:hypothetical protein
MRVPPPYSVRLPTVRPPVMVPPLVVMQVEHEMVGAVPPLDEIAPDPPTEDTFPFQVAAEEMYESPIADPIHCRELLIVELPPMDRDAPLR